MYRILQKITLRGLSQKGKNRINEHGNQWIINRINPNNLMLQAVEKRHKIKDELFYYEMAISIPTDENFEIVEEINQEKLLRPSAALRSKIANNRYPLRNKSTSDPYGK